MLDARMLDSLAARATEPDTYVGALYFPGSQLLVVRAKYPAAERMDKLLVAGQHRDVYIDLNSASDPATKLFVSDLGANGLRFDGQPWDTVDIGSSSYTFNGDWGAAQLSRDEYTSAYQMADEQYAAMLEALIAELRKSS